MNSSVENIVKMSKGQVCEYEEVTFRGVPLLISKSKLEAAIDITWERTRNPNIKRIATEIGMRLRR